MKIAEKRLTGAVSAKGLAFIVLIAALLVVTAASAVARAAVYTPPYSYSVTERSPAAEFVTYAEADSQSGICKIMARAVTQFAGYWSSSAGAYVGPRITVSDPALAAKVSVRIVNASTKDWARALQSLRAALIKLRAENEVRLLR